MQYLPPPITLYVSRCMIYFDNRHANLSISFGLHQCLCLLQVSLLVTSIFILYVDDRFWKHIFRVKMGLKYWVQIYQKYRVPIIWYFYYLISINNEYHIFLAWIFAHKPPLTQLNWLVWSRVSGSLVETPGRKEKLRQVARTAIFISKRAKRIPTQPRGPWPKAWKAYLRRLENGELLSSDWMLLTDVD